MRMVDRTAHHLGSKYATLLTTALLILGGGLPIKAGDEVIAGIGVGGAPGGEKDEACAQAGIEKITPRLR